MFERFRNREILKGTKLIAIVTFVGIAISIFSIIYNTNLINKRVVEVNSSLFGRIVSEHPELKDELAVNFTRPIDKEYQKIGEELLSSYGYDTSMIIVSNKALEPIYRWFIIQFIIITLLIVGLIYMIFYESMGNVYKDITSISAVARRVVEGNFNRVNVSYREGDIPILKESFNLMVESLENNINLLSREKNFLNDLISDITHQLKTPLSSLIMFNELIGSLSLEDVEMLEDCVQSSREQLSRMEWLVQNLLKLARLESGSITFIKEPVSIGDTIEKSIAPFKILSKDEQKIVIEGDLDQVIYHDSHWMSEALSNIIKNAVEHSSDESKVRVVIESGQIFITIKIIDSGEGIDEYDRKRIFTRFYRGKNPKNTNSIGIGLSLAKSIIEGQDGEIKVQSEKGKGTTFTISMYKKNQGAV